MPDSPTDAELVQEVKNGNDEAMQELVSRHLDAIYGFCVRYTGNPDDAQDATQETFVKTWRSIRRFDTQKSLRTWLFAIARNAANDILRKRRHIPFSLFDASDSDVSITDTIASEESLPDEMFDELARAEGAREALTQLKPRDQLIMSMRYEDDLSFEEIATVLRIPSATVRSLHRRALTTLKGILFPLQQN